jgi:hypothetical protein
MAVVGIIFLLMGFIFCLTIIGTFIGAPMMFLGAVFLIVGLSRRKTVITNVVQVTNTAPAQAWQDRAASPAQGASSAPQAIPAGVQAPQLANSEMRAQKQCISCNSQNDPSGRFCNNCGAALAPA